MHQCSIKGHMYKWISQYLTNRKTCIQTKDISAGKNIQKEGVQQEGVLSPTLFIVFMNDALDNLPKWIHGAIYGDDLVIWCSEEYITTATVRM